MAKITGLGGIFIKSEDKTALMEWYRSNLGLPLEDYGGINFDWRNAENPDEKGYTLFSLFDKDTTYFAPSKAPFMINFRVDDLDAIRQELKTRGVTVLDQVEEGDFGRFGWILDPEGNRIELWEPPEGQRG
ncbi:MAG: VOC family protein [Alphaproteobacteria bacterium]|nr:MAG: VOC family protein [Alphaproteobacteria bacterium]